MSNFRAVAQLNEAFGNTEVGWDWERLQRQFHLIAEEFKESHDAIEARDKKEVVDGCCDLLVTVYGLLHLAGVDADAAMRRVSASNFSKLCTTAEVVEKTLKHYANLGVSVSPQGELPKAYVVVTEDCHDISGKFYPAKKFLKSVNWKAPSFEGLL
jgi:predicted HAD superfamily Cof-like phosphohydrolase